MALFGLPGGSEIFVILTVIVLIFAPGLAWLGLGYLLGRRDTGRKTGAYVSPAAPPIEPAPAPDALPKAAVEDSPHPDDADTEKDADTEADADAETNAGTTADDHPAHHDQEGPASDA